MAGTATANKASLTPSQQQTVESPEIVAARAKSNEAGYARNRAEATYNAVKKEHGADSAEAQAAKKTLEAAQAEVEKAQAELRAVLKLSTKSSPAPTSQAAKKQAPAKPAPEARTPVPVEAPKAAYIERYQVVLPRAQVYEYIQIAPTLKDRAELRKRLEQLLKEIETEPKNIEFYRKQLQQNNGESLRILEVPKGEVLQTQSTLLLQKR